MSLRTHLVLAFGMVAAVPLVGGALGIFAQRTALARMEAVVASRAEDDRLAEAARKVEVAMRVQVQAWKDLVAHGSNPTARKQPAEALRQARAEAQAALADVEQRATALGVKVPSLAELRTAHRNVETRYENATAELNGGSDAAFAASDRLNDFDQTIYPPLAALVAGIDQQVAERVQERTRAVRESANLHSLLLGAGTLLGVIIAGIFGVYTSNAIVRHLRTVVGRMEERTLSVASTAEQVANSSTSLASACSNQASELEASSAAMAEVQATVQQNADRARGVEEATRDNRAAVERSAAALGEMTAAMQEISAANQKIGEIVKSIDGIAFQTNLLALNAAVEAARAGEAGAGFSVVAGEVRELARRTALQARDTTTRIEDAVSRAARGAELSERVGQEISALVQNAGRMDSLIGQIATATREQATAVSGVLQNLTTVDNLTQENAGISEETAAAAETLRQQVQGLKTELARVLAADNSARETGRTNPMTARPPLAHLTPAA